jgi:hypothetical protein
MFANYENILIKSWQSHNFLEMWQFFWKFSKKFPWSCCFAPFFYSKMANFCHKKNQSLCCSFSHSSHGCALLQIEDVVRAVRRACHRTSVEDRREAAWDNVETKSFLLRYRRHHVKERDDCKLNCNNV